jgi:hypothetical protein
MNTAIHAYHIMDSVARLIEGTVFLSSPQTVNKQPN